MQTNSVMIQSLCVPCCNRCRYCLLSWNGTTVGADWERSVRTAERLLKELRTQRPELNSSFSFGYAMEHPNLREAIRTLRRLGSPTASFLQCDGMKMRSESKCRALVRMLLDEGIEQLNFTVYGLPAYHDRFAGREGDYDLIRRMAEAAREAGLSFTVGIPLTAENADQAEELTERIQHAGSAAVRLFIPHEEGRGRLLDGIRLRQRDLSKLSADTRALLDEKSYRTEADWLREPEPIQARNRLILISLRRDNIDEYEQRDALSILKELEDMDERYYAAFPAFAALAQRYGDPKGDRLYQIRDLFYHYRRLYAEEHPIDIPDVMDETRSGSRRY